MHHKTFYKGTKEAIDILKEKGYETDFNLKEDKIISDSGKYSPDDLEIKEVYYYEGESNPADESTVYGIETTSGERGILVAGSASTLDPKTAEVIRKLEIKHKNG
ncbi:MAG: hypothetical protein R3277_11910 [Brumimicrobium sp.]|nr:hypothetical protein [Brumimicrobium sp.]